jgi:hypothetical protein
VSAAGLLPSLVSLQGGAFDLLGLFVVLVFVTNEEVFQPQSSLFLFFFYRLCPET